MKRRLGLALLVFVLSVTNAFAPVTAIKAGKLVMPETGTTLNNQVILVEAGQIKSVAAMRKLRVHARSVDRLKPAYKMV